MAINFAAANTAGLNNPGTEIITLVKDGSGNFFINPPSYDKMLAYLRSGDVPCLFVTDAAGTTGDIYQLSGYSETENKIRFAGEKTAIEFSAGSDMPIETAGEGGGVVNVEWNQCPEAVRNVLAAAQVAYSDTSVTVIDQYAPSRGNEVIANTKPIGYTIDGVTFYDNEPNVATPFATQNKAGTLTALDRLRWINTTPATPAAGSKYNRGENCRDLGGWACDGGTIKYGMLVRGSEPNSADKELMVNKIGIKTEVQLLPLSEQATDYKMKSAWGIDWAGNDTENESIYTLESSKELWRKLLEPILDSVIHAKPVYFHCGIGADRTGMIASALEGLLGVSRADIDMEYELTNFAFGWQSLEGGIYRSRTYTSYVAIMNQLANVPLLYGLTDTFRNKWVSFVLSCGISIGKINAFRAACIDGTPDVIVINVPTYSVTNNLTHITSSNNAQSVEENTAYTATLTADSWFTISTVTVTMGGADITATAYSNGKISIQNVTGDIVITATATEIARENLLTMNDGKINKRFNATNTESTANGYFITDYFDFHSGIRIVKGYLNAQGIASSNHYGNCRIGFYDANKTFITAGYLADTDKTGSGNYVSFEKDGDDWVRANFTTFTGISNWSAVKYIRVTLSLNNAASAIASVDEVLNSGMKIYAE